MSEVCNGNHQVNSSNHHRRVNRLWVEWKIQIEAKEYQSHSGRRKKNWTYWVKLQRACGLHTNDMSELHTTIQIDTGCRLGGRGKLSSRLQASSSLAPWSWNSEITWYSLIYILDRVIVFRKPRWLIYPILSYPVRRNKTTQVKLHVSSLWWVCVTSGKRYYVYATVIYTKAHNYKVW